MVQIDSVIPFYPKYSIRERKVVDGYEIVIETYLRKKYRGKWYDLLIREWMHNTRDVGIIDDNQKLHGVERLVSNVYKCMLYHKIDLKLQNTDGSKFYQPSNYQGEEIDRLK